MNIVIKSATANDASHVATMVGELLDEIMRAGNAAGFKFNLDETIARIKDLIARRIYHIFIAEQLSASRQVGFLTLCESHSLYAEGVLGIIQELYVQPVYRSQRVGQLLLEKAKEFALARNWKRLEVTTPPLPQFDRTLRFYEQQGFGITGGRKLKILL